MPSVNIGHRPPADPSGIELRYSHQHHWDASREDMPESWYVSADIPDPDSADGQSVVVHVGDIEIIRIDPYRRDAFDLLDAHSADLARIGEIVLKHGTGGLNPMLEDELEMPGTELLILNRVQLAPEWRGFGIGVLLTGITIQRLSGGCQVVVCDPASLVHIDDTDDDNGEGGDTADTASNQASRAKLSEVWSQLGFAPFRDGVHVLDLALATLDDSIERLRDRITRYR